MTDFIRTFASATLLWMRKDMERATAMAYWCGDHAQLVARNPGILEYRQHHFDAQNPGVWRETPGLETRIPVERRIDGMPEVLLIGLRALLVGRRQNKRIQKDEANVFSRTIGHATKPGGGRRYELNRPGTVRARCIVLLRKKPECSDDDFVRFVNAVLAPALRAAAEVLELRTMPFMKWNPKMWNSPGVDHDYPEPSRFHSAIVVGARDVDALNCALNSPVLAATAREQVKHCVAIHAYTVSATYAYRLDGRPTLPQIRREERPRLDPVQRHLPPAPSPAEADNRTHEFVDVRRFSVEGDSPEHVVTDGAGRLICGVSDGRILRVDPESGHQEVIGDTQGRPLGMTFSHDGSLIVCDARKGLLRLDPATGKIETLVQYVDDVPLRFCSNAAVGADGTIWFTESTSRFDFEDYAGALFEHRPSGRLLRRDPHGRVAVLLENLHFPNGVTLSPDESALFFAETDGYRLNRLWLKGPRTGECEVLVDNLPGFPDNLSGFKNGRFWVSMVGPRSAFLDRLGRSPAFVRKLIWKSLKGPQEPQVKTLWGMAFNEHGQMVANARIDTDVFYASTGLAEDRGRLFFASVDANGLAQAKLHPVQPDPQANG